MSGYAQGGAAAVTTPAPATKWQADHAKRPGQQQAAQQQQGAGGGAAAAATTGGELAVQHRAANGVVYFVYGDPQGPFTSIRTLSPERKQRLLATNRIYFGADPHMFYYTDGSIGLAANSSSSMLGHPQSLRDHSATINIITDEMVDIHGLPVRPTSRQLATGAVKVAGTHELVHELLSVCLLLGSRHSVRVPMTPTLVVPKTHLFDFLNSNPQMHAVADFIMTYPSPQLHFRPNVLEHPDLLVTIPMRNAPHPPPRPSHSKHFEKPAFDVLPKGVTVHGCPIHGENTHLLHVQCEVIREPWCSSSGVVAI
ncbi:hypothetical protein GPECTOR_344g89 [Gonium pectorale]|uniref:Uncharacterized protein n=1 Tax=Gonium pectorale TaxID=33097 RepID=A0A150FVJ4_GONPE|nr:hypothetical protein GPECTOR_344g89 [Gonium pectorale]|eukprot:KXZ41643.1 hypothetical protein GPECTOR_344g89 [Gonium pectorale]